jgi:hypothetical protein
MTIKSWKMGHLADVGEKIKRCKIICGKPEGNGLLINPKHRWVDDIVMDLQELEGGVDWIYLAQYMDEWRVSVKAMVNIRIP